MQIPILNGIYTDEKSDFRTSYPRNLIPVPVQQGISNGYLRPADGIVENGVGTGNSRGGINWDDVCFRTSGTRMIEVAEDGTSIARGIVEGDGQVTMDYSFDRLAIAGGGNLYYWDKVDFTQVTDPDLGVVLDVLFVDGYFMTTDGEFLVVTDLNDPTSINPLKYGSSEVDPDPVKALLKLKNEPHALNRYTMEVFNNVGGSGFPFQRVDGAQVGRGTVGTHACCVFLDSIAFVGGGRKESIAVWLAAGGSSVKISVREIDQILAEYSEKTLSSMLVETRVDKGHQHLLLHLPDQTLVYDGYASQVMDESVWFILTSDVEGRAQYLATNIIWCYNQWLVADPASAKLGYLTTESAHHWGELIGWDFNTTIIYNESNGAIFHELELVALTGRAELDDDPTISTQYSLDGEEYSMPRTIKVGRRGQRKKRLVWLNQGPMRNWRTQKFNGTSATMLSIARLEARVEALGV